MKSKSKSKSNDRLPAPSIPAAIGAADAMSWFSPWLLIGADAFGCRWRRQGGAALLSNQRDRTMKLSDLLMLSNRSQCIAGTLPASTLSFCHCQVLPLLFAPLDVGQVPTGHVWLTGDNLILSRDSREYGPVPLALMRGRVVAQVSSAQLSSARPAGRHPGPLAALPLVSKSNSQNYKAL
jgi:hypothetical protein